MSLLSIQHGGRNRICEREREFDQELRIGVAQVEHDRSGSLVGHDALREVTRSRFLGARPTPDEPAVEIAVSGLLETETPFEGMEEVGRGDDLTVRISDPRTEVEPVGSTSVRRRGDGRGEVGDERGAVGSTDRLERDEAVAQ